VTAAADEFFVDPGVWLAGISRLPRLPDAAFLIVPPAIVNPLAQESLHRDEVNTW
jgi:hypothetical protein